MKKILVVSLVSTLTIVILLVAGVLPTVALEPQYGGILRIADPYRTTFLGSPQKMPAGWVSRQAAPGIESLLIYDDNCDILPWLATGYKSDASAKTITLTLRKDVKFHDGTDFNAEAVKWNLDEAVKQKQFGSALIKSVDVLDDYTVRINLAEWNSSLLDFLASSYMGLMISPTAFKKFGEDYIINHPVGTGPFKIVSWEKDVKIAYTRFDDYWQKGKPYLDGLELIYTADKVVGLLSFRKGETDMMLYPFSKDVARLRSEGYKVSGTSGGFGSPLGAAIPNSADPSSPFADLRVRQAAQHAIDGKALVKAVLSGEGRPATQWAYQDHWAYNPDIVGYPYNPRKAKQLLAEAGYPKGFKTKYTYPSMLPQNAAPEAVAGQLKEVGIEVELNPVTMPAWITLIFKGHSWEGLVMNGPPPYPDVTAGLHERYAGDGMHYASMIAPDDYKEAIRRAIIAPNFEAKKKYTHEALKLMTDKYALTLYWYWYTRHAVAQKYVHDTGIFEAPSDSQWTPADAWMERK